MTWIIYAYSLFMAAIVGLAVASQSWGTAAFNALLAILTVIHLVSKA